MKKKSLAALLSGLLTVSLTGVGFASWLIVGGAQDSVIGNITVETVEDKRVTLTVADTFGEDGIYFGSNQTAENVAGKWLKSNESTTKEDLSASITYSVGNADQATSIKYSLSSDKIAQLKYCIDQNYLALAGWTYVAASGDVVAHYEKTVTSVTASMTADITFSWGSYFSGANPFTYFNNYSSASATTAKVNPDTSSAFANAGDEAMFVLGKIAEIGTTEVAETTKKTTPFTLTIEAIA